MATHPTSAPTMSSAVPSAGGVGTTAAPLPTAGQAEPSPASSQASANGKSDPTADQTDENQEQTSDDSGRSLFLLLNATPSWLVSMVVHAVGLLILALITLPELKKSDHVLVANTALDEGKDLQEFAVDTLEPVDLEEASSAELAPASVSVVTEVAAPSATEFQVATNIEAGPVNVQLTDLGNLAGRQEDLVGSIRSAASAGGSAFGNRKGEGRREALKAGATKESESAVAAALKWLAEHQLPNGSWSFDHRMCPRCGGKCRDAGKLSAATNGATAMALLPFLGAGQTHKEGNYKDTVERGLYYLVTHMKVEGARGELSDPGGNMYSHGLATIVLTEAYAMTEDRALLQPAQLAINHIVYAQDPVGGGWRYAPRQAGDTSVVGWQLMALKSGHMAYLTVPSSTVIGATRFLDSVQSDGGARYGYAGPGEGHAQTAIGLLSRMYLGWRQENPALKRGVDWVSKLGPSKTDMYYNYYATQVMRHWEGERWEKWNKDMRDGLVSAQEKRGHEAGSWYMADPHGGDHGGRLYCTSMSTMILEVYYRHMPIYGKQAAEEDFPL